MSFLERILPGKREEAARLEAAFSVQPARRPENMPIRDFSKALTRPLAVIAEVKHKSPSHPHFKQPAAPARLARAYRRGGAAALSVVTDQANFGTSLADVAAMREASGLPVLVKDFIIDSSQILAAWAAGADAVLLIARMLEPDQLARLLAEVHELGLTALVECHDAVDITRSLAAGAVIIGINNRNLATLTTDVGQTPLLLPLIPEGVITVSESGIDRRDQIEELAAAGADAFLIGHALLMSPDPGRKVRELTGMEREGQQRSKVCGITSAADATACQELGADFLGVIFADSPRQVDEAAALSIRQSVPEARLCGVFLDAELNEVVRLSEACDLDLIQLHGQESPDYCQELMDRTGLPLIKVLVPEELSPSLVDSFAKVTYLMIDLPKGDPGQTGAQKQQELADLVAVIGRSGREVFLAGGLNPQNVGAALNVAPFAVDVCSGVEYEPGRKDLSKVAAFLQEVGR